MKEPQVQTFDLFFSESGTGEQALAQPVVI